MKARHPLNQFAAKEQKIRKKYEDLTAGDISNLRKLIRNNVPKLHIRRDLNISVNIISTEQMRIKQSLAIRN